MTANSTTSPPARPAPTRQTPARPASSRSEQSRQKLLRAATDLLVEYGPRGVTVDAVAEESGVAKSTLYRHWSSRDDLMVAVVRHNLPQHVDPALDGDFETVLLRYLAVAAEALSDPNWSQILPAMMSLRVSMPAVAQMIEVDQADRTRALSELLAVGTAEGLLPADIDADTTGKLLFGPLVFAVISGDDDGLTALADTVGRRFIASYRH